MRVESQSLGARRFAVVGALLAVLVTAAYLPLRHNELVNFDDDRLITDNPALRDLSPAGAGGIFGRQLFTPHYKPLVNLSWAIELRLFGADPWAFHRHNLMLHLVSVWLVLALAALLCPAGVRRRERILWAGIVAALWALHPMKVESVAWAAERKDVLFAAFYFGSMLTYLLWVDGRRRRWLVLSALLALAGVLSKSTAITLPLALLLVDLVRRRRWGRALVLDKLPHLVVVAAALVLYGLVPLAGPASGSLPLLAAGHPGQRLVEAAHRHLAFAGRWLLPTDLAVLYPIPDWLGRPQWPRLAALAAAHLGLGLGLLLAVRRHRLAAAAALFYSVGLLPTLAAPISTTNYLSDRYIYLPSLGLTVLLVLAVAWLHRQRPRFAAAALGVAALASLLLLGALTYRQVGVWRDSERLWDHTLAVRPPHAFAHNNRGVARLARGDRAGALADFNRAVELRPAYAAALANRGDLHRRAGRLGAALADLDRAVAAEPGHGRLYRARAAARLDLGRSAAALADLDRALELDPADREALYLRAQARYRTGDDAAARADLDRVLAAGAATHRQLLLRALVRARQGDLRGALEDSSRALDLEPASAVALNNRGFLQLQLGRPAAALADLDRALSHRPTYPLAQRTRGDALAALDRHEEACAAWRRAAAGGAPRTTDRLAACP